VTLSRLDNQQIADPIQRSYLHRVVRDKSLTFDLDLITHFIALDEQYRPDLVSYRVYKTPELQWMVTLIYGNEDPAAAMKAGTELRLPPLAWVREQIRHYANGGEVAGTLIEE